MGLKKSISKPMGQPTSTVSDLSEELSLLSPDTIQQDYAALTRGEKRQYLKGMALLSWSSDFLLAQASQETDPLLQQTVFDSLIHLARSTGLAQTLAEAMLALLAEGDASVRKQAIYFLSTFPEATAVVMPELLTDPNADKRLYALDILQHLVHPDVPYWLNSVLAEEEHPNVMASAIDRCLEAGFTELPLRLDDIAQRFSNTPFILFSLSLARKRIEGVTE